MLENASATQCNSGREEAVAVASTAVAGLSLADLGAEIYIAIGNEHVADRPSVPLCCVCTVPCPSSPPWPEGMQFALRRMLAPSCAST
jgi:hypothetical protein